MIFISIANRFVWASFEIPKIADCACAGNAGTFLPPPRVSDSDMHHGRCVTHVPWCMSGSLTSGFLWIPYRWKRTGACATLNFTYLVWGPWCGGISLIITLVRHKKARFDSEMHGSTQKSPVRHINARFDTKCPPQHAPVDIAIIKHPPPLPWERFFSNFIPIFCF